MTTATVDNKDLVTRSHEILKSKLGKAKVLAIAAAIVPLAAAIPHEAKAELTSRVKAEVKEAEGKFKYQFTVINTSDPGASGGIAATNDDDDNGIPRPWLVNWQLPVFDAKDISDIKAPEGWSYEIVKVDQKTEYYNNPDGLYGQYTWQWDKAKDPTLKSLKIENAAAYYGAKPEVFAKPPLVINFYSKAEKNDDGRTVPLKPIGSYDQLAGFSFVSTYNSANAPYLPAWYLSTGKLMPSLAGRALTPNSPAFQAAQTTKVSAAN